MQREAARQREGERGSRVAEVVVEAKESLNYKTTGVDDRPKNAAGRGAGRFSRFLRLLIASYFFPLYLERISYQLFVEIEY